MTRFLSAATLAVLVFGFVGALSARDDNSVKAVLDKAINALGGEEKLSKVHAASWKGKGTITFNGMDNEFKTASTVEGFEHFRSEFEGEFGGNTVKGVTVLAGDKAWRSFGDMGVNEMDKDAVANEKRSVYLQVIPMTILPLKGKGYKVESAGEEKVDGKAAVALKVTPADGKEFKIYFDKDSGLPVRVVAKVLGFMGDEFTQDTTLGDYKDINGIKKAMKSESKRDGEKFLSAHLDEFKVLDKVDPKTFAEPK
jgi:hypothetical protein